MRNYIDPNIVVGFFFGSNGENPDFTRKTNKNNLKNLSFNYKKIKSKINLN